MRMIIRFALFIGLMISSFSVNAQSVTIVDFGAKLGSGWPRGVIPQYFDPHIDRTGDGTLTNDFVSAYPFSLDVPFTPPGLDFDTNVNSAIFYGGMTLYTVADEGPRPLTEGHLNQNHEFKDDFNLMTLPGPRTNVVSGEVEELLEAYGVWIWTKEHFYNDGADHVVTFDADSYIAVDITRYWGGINAGRWLVRDGDQFYLSEETFAGETNQYYVGMSADPGQHGSGNNPVFRRTHTLNPGDSRWAPYDPVPDPAYPYEIDFDVSSAVFDDHVFTNVTAVGWFAERYLSRPYPVSPALTLDEPISLKWGAFRVQAVVDAPFAPSSNMDMSDIGDVYLADEPVSYDLWRKMFRFGQRRQHVRDELGISTYVFERDGSMGMMRATNGEHNRLEPVTDITWYDALAFCNALSQWEGLEPAYYTDPDHTNVFKMIFDRDKKELWDERPTIYWNTNAPGFRLPTPAEWEELDVSLRGTSYWEHVWFPAGTVADPAAETTRTALGWAPDAPTESILTFGEQPWWGSPRITFRPVRNGAGTPIMGAPSVATEWNYSAATVLPPAAEPTEEMMRNYIAQYLPEVVLDVGLANTNHVVDLDFNPETSIDPSGSYPVSVGATEVPYRLWNYVQQWALNNGYSFNYSGAMGSMGAIPGDVRDFHPDEPVTQMSWFDLISWCNALSEMMGLEPVYYRDGDFTEVWRETTQFRLETYQDERYPNWGQIPADPVDTGFYITNYMNAAASGFRIPLPQEWDLANVTDANSGTDDYNWLDFNSDGKTQPVGTKLPNPVGLYDMEGNVREWTWGDTRATISRVIRRKGSHFARGFQASHHFIDSHEVPSVGSTHVGFRTVRLHQELSASPELFEYAGTSDQSFSPRTLTISNIGYDSVSYTIATSATWMAVSPSSYSGLGNGGQAQHSLTLNTPLAGGTYEGEIIITPDDPGIPALTSRVEVVIVERGTGEVVRARVDFGRPEHMSGGTWNNITDPVAGSVSGLIDTDGFENNITVAIIDPFAAMIAGGTEAPDAGLDYPASASRDTVTGGNPSSLVMAWGGDYITGDANMQMVWQLAGDTLNESTIRSPSGAAFNRSKRGGKFYANVKRGPDNTINYNHVDDNGGANIISHQLRRDSATGDIVGHGAFVWKKEDFAGGFDTADAQITRFRLEAAAGGPSGSHTFRWLVKVGSQYYVSSNTYTVSGTSYTTVDAAVSEVAGWEAYNPTTDLTYTPGTYSALTLTNITAVGYYVHSYRADTPPNQILRLNVRAFEVYGAEAGSEPATESRIRISGLNTDLRYALRMFASLEGTTANVQTEYRVHHADGVVTNWLNPVNNTALVVDTDPLEPDANGYIEIDLLPGPANTDEEGKYVLGVLEVVFTNLLENVVGDPDTDGDGIPDWWEELHFGGPTNAVASALAANNVNTLLEAYIADINPTNPASFFVIEDLSPAVIGNVLQWNAVSGRVYRVYWSTNLLEGVGGFELLQDGLVTGVFTNELHPHEERVFYRLGVELE